MYFHIFVIFLVSMCNEHSITAFGLNISLLGEILLRFWWKELEFFFPLRSMLHLVARCSVLITIINFNLKLKPGSFVIFPQLFKSIMWSKLLVPWAFTHLNIQPRSFHPHSFQQPWVNLAPVGSRHHNPFSNPCGGQTPQTQHLIPAGGNLTYLK